MLDIITSPETRRLLGRKTPLPLPILATLIHADPVDGRAGWPVARCWPGQNAQQLDGRAPVLTRWPGGSGESFHTASVTLWHAANSCRSSLYYFEPPCTNCYDYVLSSLYRVNLRSERISCNNVKTNVWPYFTRSVGLCVWLVLNFLFTDLWFLIACFYCMF